MKTLTYNILKGWFILSFMAVLFFIIDILQGISMGIEVAPVTHMNADWAVFGIMTLLLLAISSCLYLIWASKHNVES